MVELFDDEYFFAKSIFVRTVNESGIEVTTEGELGSKGATGSLSISRLGNPISFDNLRIRSDGRVLLEGSLVTSNITKLTVAAEDGRQEPGKPVQSFGKLGCEINVPNSKFGAIFDVDVVNGPLFSTSILTSPTSNVYLGMEAVVNSHFEDKGRSVELIDCNIGMQYVGPQWTASARSYDSFNTLKLAYIHSPSNNFTFGSHIDYRKKTNTQKLSLAADVKLSDATRIKGKIDTSSVVAASFKHKLSPALSLLLCAEVFNF